MNDRLAEIQHEVEQDDGATRIVSLHEGDPLPQGTRFCQIVGSKLEHGGRRSRRVYLVLVEQVSCSPRG